MSKDLRDEIIRLTLGKPTKSRIGSRHTPSRLTQKERKQLDAALKKDILVINPYKKPRINLINIFSRMQEARGKEVKIIQYRK